jgi:DNA-binding NtrC family response regulator
MSGPGGRPYDIHAEALAVLVHHPWPGNIRELENVMRRARRSVRTRHGTDIRPEDLSFDFGAQTTPEDEDAIKALRRVIAWAWRNHGGKKPFPLLVELLERELLRYALRQPHKSENELADAIGIVKNTLRKWKEAYGLAKSDETAK